MYFVTGGAFNGKSKWVKAYNQLTPNHCSWYSAYHHDPFPHCLEQRMKDCVVIEGIEQWIREWLKDHSGEDVREKWQSTLDQWQSWENSDGKRKVFFIGTDITKGIVPIDSEDRVWRDVCGRVFQDTATQCDRVELIWYGMNRRIK